MRYFPGFLLIVSLCAVAQMSPDDFDSIEARTASEIAPDSLGDEFFESLADAGGNWRELARFVSSFGEENLLDAIWLVNKMPHLDRLLATEEVLREHLDYSYTVREKAPWAIPDSMFLPFIVTYRLSYEPITRWRALFYDRFFSEVEASGNVRDAARTINRWVAENIDTAAYEFFGGMQSPDMTFRRGKGTRGEISALTNAILKSLGIPSRNTMIRTLRGHKGGMSWVEVFDSKENIWIPLYPDNPDVFGDFGYPSAKFPGGVTVVTAIGGFERNLVTGAYTKTGFLASSFYKGGKPAAKWEHFSVCAISAGAYWPLDEIGAEADSIGEFEIELGVGEYVLQCGMRDRTGSVWVQIVPFVIAEGETASMTFDVDAPQYINASAAAPGEFPEFTINDLSGNPFSHNQAKGKRPLVMFFFDPDAEPSIRALEQVERIAAEFSDSVRFFGVWVKQTDDELSLEIPWRTLIDENGTLAMTITGCENIEQLENDRLPAILFSEGDDLRFEIVSDGYNMNIEGLLRNRLEEWQN